MTEEYTEVQVLPTGIYRVRYKRMTPSQLKSMRTRTRGKLRKLRRKRDYRLDQARTLGFEIEGLERILEECGKPEVEVFLERYATMKEEAEARAEEYLREFLEEEGYADFKRQGWLELEDRNGDGWRVYADGSAYRWTEEGLRGVCIVRSRGLPLPDHVVSVITSIRERPESYSR